MPSMLRLKVPRKLFTIRLRKLSRPSSFRPSQIHSNTKPRPIPTGTGYRLTISSISNSPAISLHNSHDLAHHYDDFMVTDGIGCELGLHERIERISGLNLLDSAIHSDCVVTSFLKFHPEPSPTLDVPVTILCLKAISWHILFCRSSHSRFH